MSKESKKHHFNPRHILRNFRLDDKSPLYVFDKLEERSFTSSPDHAGHEKHFNSVLVGDQRVNLEPAFQYADDRQSILIRKIIAEREIAKLTSEERFELAELVVIQWLRVKIIRDNLGAIPNLLKEAFGDFGVDDSVVPDIDPNMAKLQSFQILSNAQQYAPYVLQKDWCLITPPENGWFWTSDNPICITNEFKSGDSGLGSQGSKISWPISKDLMLQFACPSITNKIAATDELAASYLRSEPTMFCSPEHLEAFNLNQLVNATRFVYAPSNDFSIAKTFLKANPAAKSKGNQLKIGQLGDHPESIEKTLVVNGAATIHEIPFESWSDCGSHLFVRVADGNEEELARAINDSPHSAITINDSEKGSRHMKGVEFNQDTTQPREATVRHSDPLLAKIMVQDFDS